MDINSLLTMIVTIYLIALPTGFIIIVFFALCCSIFKRARMFYQVRKELKRVLRHNTLLERSWKDEPAVQQMCKEEVMLQHTGVQKQQEEPCVDYDDDEILTMESATALLKSLGWSVEIEGKGDHLATYFLPDREVQFLYNDEKVKDSPQFDCGIVVTSVILAAACETLHPYNSKSLPGLQLDFNAKGLEIFQERVSVGRLKQALEKALEKAMKTVDLREKIHAHCGTSPWEKDTLFLVKEESKLVSYDLRHLSALALLGDVETLKSYSKSFAQGNRLGFEEGLFDINIKEIHLERAVVLAQECVKAKQLSYDLLERVAVDLFPQDTVESYQYFRSRDPQLCNRKRDSHKKLVEEKKQQLRKQGFIVYEEEMMCQVDEENYCHDILYIKDGALKFMDIKTGV